MRYTFDDFTRAIRETGVLESCAALLDWDAEVNMPPKGLTLRAEQLSLLSRLAHERRTDPKIGDMLAALDGQATNEAQETNLREVRRAYDRAVKIPAALVERISRVSTVAKDVWARARKENDFAAFAPHLEELIDLKRQVADAVGYKTERYDALLDEYEPGMTAADVSRLFGELRGPLSAFVKELMNAGRQPDASILSRKYPVDMQTLWCRQSAERIGFDFESGRIDVSTHPFCSGTGPGDVRLTTRYYEDYFPAAVFGTLHESGHGLYEQGLPVEHAFTPRGQAASLGIHESQSRLWENFVGRSHAYWRRFYPQCRVAFADALGDVSLDAFYAAINAVRPSLIRVEADEVTYNLHIIVRFELERDMLDGRLAIRDLPQAWHARMHELLGVTPTSDADGCLQDIHWAMAAVGYFPTYALGNLYAAQFFAAIRRAQPDVDDQVERGEFSGILRWLRENIHIHGQRYRPAELVQRATGAAPTIQPFIEYIHAKFRPIYGLA